MKNAEDHFIKNAEGKRIAEGKDKQSQKYSIAKGAR
jgi:hypothetical protein